MTAKTNGNAGTTLLERLDKVVTIDVDTMDSDFIGKLPITPCDMTCNPRWLHFYMTDPVNKELVEKVVKENKGKRWDEIYCRIAAALEARIAPLVSGRVLAQVSPSHSYDADYIIWQGRQYSQAWKDVGISADRCCVKVPLTSAGIAAAKMLQAEGIATLGTSLFNIQQAIAAAQVGQYAVSMYFNDPKVWFESSAWVDTERPASEHPMASRHARMRVIYDELQKRTGKKPPQIKTASFVSSREIVAMAVLGCDHVTLNNALLSDLLVPGVPKYRSGLWKVPISKQQGDADFAFEDWEAPSPEAVKKAMEIANSDPLTPGETADWLAKALSVDYTAPGVLDKINEEDPATKERLGFATEYFSSQEKLSQEFIEGLIKELH